MIRRYFVSLVALLWLAAGPAWGQVVSLNPSDTVVSGTSSFAGSASQALIGPCDILYQTGTPCVAAYSPARKLIGSYGGYGLRLIRASDSTTQDIGYLANGLLNVVAANSFCLGTDCAVQIIYDQSGNGNNLTSPNNSFAVNTIGSPPPWTIYYKNGLPMISSIQSKSALRNRTTTSNIPTGTSGSETYEVRATDVYSTCCGGFGRMEAYVASGCGTPTAPNCPGGSMFTTAYSSYQRFSTAAPNTVLGFGADMEYYEPNELIPTIPAIASLFNKWSSTTSTLTMSWGDATKTALNVSFSGQLSFTPAVQAGLSLGEGGDGSAAGSQFFEGAVTNGTPSAAAEILMQANIAAFYGSQAAPTLPPIDAFAQQGSMAGGGSVDQSIIVNGAYGLRRLRLGYTGYAAQIIRASDSTSLNVGFSSTGDFDDATAQNFCASTTCYALLANQAFVSTSNYTHHSTNDTQLASGQTNSQLPTLAFNSLNGRTVLQFTGTQGICTATSYNGLSQPWTVNIVAERTGATTTRQDVYSTDNTSQMALGFNSAANQALFWFVQPSSTTATATDNSWHSITGVNSNGAVSLSVDNGTASTATPTTTVMNNYACIGGMYAGGGAFRNNLTGYVAEVLTFETNLSAAQVTTLYQNQHTYYGNQF